MRVVGINYKAIGIVHEISFVTVALMSIKINYQHFFNSAPLPCKVDSYRDVRVDAKPS